MNPWIGRVAAAVAMAVAVGCGPATTQIRPQAPWDPELAPFFDDAADFIADPGGLEGSWATDYAGELRGRVDAADLIARVLVTTVREDISIDGTRRKHLVMQVTSVLDGQEPPEARLQVAVDEGSAGFDTVDRNVRRLLANRFVAFVRWYEDDEGTLRSHWHLSPASPQVIRATRSALEVRQRARPSDGSTEED